MESSNKTKAAVGLIFLAVAGYFFLNKNVKPQNLPKPEVSGVAAEIQGRKLKEQWLEEKIFGASEKGKPILGYKIGFGENVLLFHGGIHGDELGTSDLLNKFVEEIKANPQNLATSTKLVIIPVLNPDGYFDRTDKLNANEVNLNLNFKTEGWQKYGPQGTFAGNEPFSENESQVLKQIVEDYKPIAMLAYHSSGALVSPETSEPSKALAQWYAKKSGYRYFEHWDFAGTATRWFEEAYGKPAITIELTSDFRDDWNKNKQAMLELISSDINKTIK